MSAKYEIPESIQTRVLQLYYQQYSIRQIYLAVRPEANIATFTKAMHELALKTENMVEKLREETGVPTDKEFEKAMGDADALAELALKPAVAEMNLTPGDQEALAHLDLARVTLMTEMQKCITEPLPTVDTNVINERGQRIDAQWDPRSVRAAAVALLADKIASNAAMRLKFAEFRVKRTIDFHNLRLARTEEVEKAVRRQEKEEIGTVKNDTKALPPFIVDVDTKH